MNVNVKECVKCVLERQRREKSRKEQREEILAYAVNELLTIREEIIDLMYRVNPYYEPPECTRNLCCVPVTYVVEAYKKVLRELSEQILKKEVRLDFAQTIKEELAKDASGGIRYVLRYHAEESDMKRELIEHHNFIEKFLSTCDLCKKQAAAEVLQKKSAGKHLMELTYLADSCIYGLGYETPTPPTGRVDFNNTDGVTINSCVTTLDIYNS